MKGGPEHSGPPFTTSPDVGSDSGLDGHDVDDLAAATVAELHGTGSQREQGVVATATDAGTRVEVGAALADEDRAGRDDLAAEALDAEALGVRVTAVTGRACALLVCHLAIPLLADGV